MEALTNAFSGFGVDEHSIVSLSAQWHPEHQAEFRKSSPEFFKEDERAFHRWDVHHVAKLKTEFSRFKKAAVVWAMHPWERDARFANEAIHRGPSLDLLVEIACTRSSDELLGARKAYHSLYHHSLEEDLAYHVHHSSRKLLVALASSYRYEGSYVNEQLATLEAEILNKAIKDGAGSEKPIENEHVVRILSTRSKLQLKLTFDRYKAKYGTPIDEDVADDFILQATVQCLYSPATYFSKVLNLALSVGADETAKKGLTRVIVTRAHVDMKEIEAEYQEFYGCSLVDKIGETVSGNYKNFLLALVKREA